MHWRRKWQPTPVFLPGESPDGGTWWAAVYGVTQSRTQLKRRSSSSNYTLYSEGHKINKLPTLKLLKANMKSPGMHATLIQLCLTVCDPMHCSPPGSSDSGILQAKILEWVARPSSTGSSGPRDQTRVSLCLLHFNP